MERVVILKRPSFDARDQYILLECLRILFPECTVDIQSVARRDHQVLDGCGEFSVENPTEAGMTDCSRR